MKATTTNIEHLENSEEISEKVRETSKRRIEINVSEGERLQKRYESGDSGSGIGVSSKKRHESGDSEVVNISQVNEQQQPEYLTVEATNKDLDEKLHKILQSLQELKLNGKTVQKWTRSMIMMLKQMMFQLS